MTYFLNKMMYFTALWLQLVKKIRTVSKWGWVWNWSQECRSTLEMCSYFHHVFNWSFQSKRYKIVGKFKYNYNSRMWNSSLPLNDRFLTHLIPFYITLFHLLCLLLINTVISLPPSTTFSQCQQLTLCSVAAYRLIYWAICLFFLL